MPDSIHTSKGRALFGADPSSYARIRPGYPEDVYRFLQSSGALGPDRATLEIGAGSGLATRRLLELGANPLTVIEPDARFAPLLRDIGAAHPARFDLIEAPFEEAALSAGSFDLIVAATSFHWVSRPTGMHKAARLLKPEGHLALWWNVFGDPTREDPFHQATQAILKDLSASPSGGAANMSFALDVDARLEDFARTRVFAAPQHRFLRWSLELTTDQVGALYATFSSINELEQDAQKEILDRLMDVAQNQFGGTVTRNMVSAVYLAQKARAG